MRCVRPWNTILALLLLASPFLGCRPLQDDSFEFALIGDNPYPPESLPKFEALIEEVNQDVNLEWVIHVGDIRGTAATPCSNEVFESRFELFQRFRAPFVLTPGDNDWFDCGGPASGGFEELERLDFLRKLFYANPGLTMGGRPMKVRTQNAEPGFEELVENAMWVRSDVVFSTVHIVATEPAPHNVTAVAVAERLMDAALSWIAQTFEVARELNGRGVFIATQADPWLASGNAAVLEGLCATYLEPRAGLERLYPTLAEKSIAFVRPVVLAVGDTHIFRVDKPLLSSDTGGVVENFTRVEVFGHPFIHWVRVKVDPSERAVFSFRQEIIEGNLLAPTGS